MTYLISIFFFVFVFAVQSIRWNEAQIVEVDSFRWYEGKETRVGDITKNVIDVQFVCKFTNILLLLILFSKVVERFQ